MSQWNDRKFNSGVKHVSLPTLFEYNDGHLGEWNARKKLLLQLAKVPENERKHVSKLPSLTKKIDSLDLKAVREESPFRGSKVGGNFIEGNNASVDSAETDSEDSNVSNCGESCNGVNDHFEKGSRIIAVVEDANCGDITSSGRKRNALNKKFFDRNNNRRVNCWNVGTIEEMENENSGLCSENAAKMKTVSAWVKEQASVNSVPKLDGLEEIRDKKKEMASSSIGKVLPMKNHLKPEGLCNTRAKQKHDLANTKVAQSMNENDKLELSGTRVESELSTRLFDARQKKKNAVTSKNTSQRNCENISSRFEATENGETNLETKREQTHLIPTPPRGGTPFPNNKTRSGNRYVATSNLSQSYPVQKEISLDGRNLTVKNVIREKKLEVPLRTSTAFSWPVSSYGARKRDNEQTMRRRPCTPRPPTGMVRSHSTEL